MSDEVMVLDCGYEDGPHEFPLDWVFGGADGSHPGADVRWMPTTYQYYTAKLEPLHITQTPLCDEQAIDEFSIVSTYGPDFDPVWLAVKRNGEEKFTMLPVKYDKATDTAKDLPDGA